ncbi:MAG: DUF488 domain-containing protein [Candidatus Micrarchaeales archaeon]
MLLGIKRVYERRDLTDGRRVLVDRLWPRGVKKGTQNVDLWIKEVAPSNELRKWFSHNPAKWEGFKKKYKKELDSSKKLEELVKMVKENDVTLVYAAKDTKYNNAVALGEFIKERLKNTS